MVVHDFRRTLTCSWPGSSKITLNVEEQGDGNERLLTKELLPKIVGFQKKWFKFLFVVTAYLYIEVLNENCTPSTAYGE